MPSQMANPVYPESPFRAGERQRADSKDSLDASTVKEMEDLQLGEEDQDATPYDHKLITSYVAVFEFFMI
jgi:hypothetical protein